MRKIFIIIIHSLIFIVIEIHSFHYVTDPNVIESYPPRDAENFENLALNYEHFVDKSLLIKDFLTNEHTVVVTRPRKWGKTLNMDMLKTFLQVEVDENGIPVPNNSYRILFEGGSFQIGDGQIKSLKPLKIGQNYPQLVQEHQGKYPVIRFDFKKMFRSNYATMNRAIGEKIRDIFYHDFPFLEKYFNGNTTLNGCNVRKLKKYVAGGYVKMDAADGFKLLINAVSAHFNNSMLYVLIDNYDEILYKAYLLYKTTIYEEDRNFNKGKKKSKRNKRSPDKDDANASENDREYEDDASYTDDDASYYEDDVSHKNDGACYHEEDAYYYEDDGYYDEDASYYADDVNYYDEKAASYVDDTSFYEDDSSANKDDAYERVSSMLGNIFSNIFKDTRKVRGMLTGVSIVSKKELSKDFNLYYITEDTLLDPLFINHYGFTKEEVDSLLSTSPFTPKSRDIKHWYKGYTVGNIILYNPISIMQCLRKVGELAPYSIDTRGISKIKKFISDQIKNEWIALMYANTKIVVRISENQMTYHKVTTKIPREEIYTHLLFHGYFTSVPISDDYYKISIPNHEMRSFMFHTVVGPWLEKELGIRENNTTNKNWIHHFSSALLNYHMKSLKNDINRVLGMSTHIQDRDEGNQTKKFYYDLMTLLTFPLSRHFVMNRQYLNRGKVVHLALIPATVENNIKNSIIIGIRHTRTKHKKALISKTRSLLSHIFNSSYRRNVERNAFIEQIYSIGILFCNGKARVNYRVDSNPNHCYH